VGLVLSATLFALRHLVSDWHRLSDRLTPATHVGMGVAMSCMILAPWVPPAIIGVCVLVALAVALCHRTLSWLRSRVPGARHGLETPALAMMLVMAVMTLRTSRESQAMTIAMLGCLLACASAYALPLLKRDQHAERTPALDLAAPLALTAGMVGMLVAMP